MQNPVLDKLLGVLYEKDPEATVKSCRDLVRSHEQKEIERMVFDIRPLQD